MSGKIALIPGASRGLGRSIATHLAKQGVAVIGTFLTRQDEAEPLKLKYLQPEEKRPCCS